MIIYLRKFANHNDACFKFTNGVIVVIRGSGASGKTSILRAIKYALYGGIVEGASEASVTLKYGDLVITREMPPDRLSVESNNKIYTGDEAMAIITKTFGSENMFNLGSYVKSGGIMSSPIPLLESSPAKRLAALTTLAFGDTQDPQSIVDAIRDHLKQKKKEAKTLKIQYAMLEEELPKLVEPIANDTIELLSFLHQQTLELLAKKNQQSGEIISINKRMIELELFKANLADNIAKLEKELDNINNDISKNSQLSTYFNYTDSINKSSLIKRKINELEMLKNDNIRLEELWSRLDPLLEYINHYNIEIPMSMSSNELNSINKTWNEYEYGMSICKKWNIPYTSSTLSHYMSLCKKAITYFDNKRQYELYLSAKSAYEAVNSIDLVPLELILTQMKESSNLMKCPQCSTTLCNNNGILTITSKVLVSSSDIILQESRVSTARRNNQNKERLRNKMDFLATLNVLSFRLDNEIEKITHAVEMEKDLSNVKIVNIPKYTSEQAEAIHKLFLNGWNSSLSKKNYNIDSNTIANLNMEIERLRKENSLIETDINIYHQEKLKNEHLLHRKVSTEERLQSHKKQLEYTSNEIKRLNNTFNSINNDLQLNTASDKTLEDINNRRRCLLEHIKYKEHYNRLERVKEKLETLVKEIIETTTLLREAVDEHYQRLNSVVTSLNFHIASYTPLLFHYPMSIRLSLFTIKSKSSSKIQKHSVSFEIIRDGILVPNLETEALAGSEKQRIILLVIIAIGIHIGWQRLPLLLLDEPMSRLDNETQQRSEALELLRLTNKKRTVVITEHNVIDEDYDETISLGDRTHPNSKGLLL